MSFRGPARPAFAPATVVVTLLLAALGQSR